MQRMSCLLRWCQAMNMALQKLAAQCQLPGSCRSDITCAVHPCCSPLLFPSNILCLLACSICAYWLPCRSQTQPCRSCATRYSCRSLAYCAGAKQ